MRPDMLFAWRGHCDPLGSISFPGGWDDVEFLQVLMHREEAGRLN